MSRRATGTIVHKPNGTFGLRFTVPTKEGGRRQYRSLPPGSTREDAENQLALILAQVKVGEWKPPKPALKVEPNTDPLFWDFAEEWLDVHRGEWSPTRCSTTNGSSSTTCCRTSAITG